MFCGLMLSEEQMLLQMDKRSAAAAPKPRSDKQDKTPIVEIKDPRSGKTRTEHVKQTPQPNKDEKNQ